MNGDDQLYCVTCKSMRDMETASIICYYKLIFIDKMTKHLSRKGFDGFESINKMSYTRHSRFSNFSKKSIKQTLGIFLI